MSKLGIRVYDNNPNKAMMEYVVDDTANEPENSRLWVFGRHVIAVIETRAHAHANHPITACQYILETWGMFKMMVNACDSHPSVQRHLAYACVEQMEVQFYG